MPKGIYKRTNEELERARLMGRKYGPINITKRNKSEHGREISRKNIVAFNQTDEKIELSKRNGRKYGPNNIIAFNKSEAGRERAGRIGRKNIAKVRAMRVTACQRILSKTLADNRIHNKMEWYFPEIRRLGDIAISSSKLIIEVDGSSHNGIFCTKEQKQADDKLKEEQIKSLGWNVIRVTNQEVERNLDTIIEKIKGVIGEDKNVSKKSS